MPVAALPRGHVDAGPRGRVDVNIARLPRATKWPISAVFPEERRTQGDRPGLVRGYELVTSRWRARCVKDPEVS